MTLSPSIALPDADKLDVLRMVDRFRPWRSLDDKRYCLVCGKIITGQQIQVQGGTRGNGALRLSCPSERCNSIPMDWVILTDEILARAEILATEELGKAATPRPVNYGRTPQPPHKTHHGIASQLLNFASHFKRGS